MKTMLVLTDFSDSAYNAALYAAALTHQLQIPKLILYHSCALIPPMQTVVPVAGSVDAKDLHTESTERLTILKNNLHSFLYEGTALEVLTDDRPLVAATEAIALQHQAGLVIMGVTGKGKLERVLVGSTTINLAKESFLPILLVPPEARFEKIRRAVFACDLKNVSASTPVKTIKSLIHSLDASLLVLNVDTEDQDHFEPDTLNEQFILHKLWDDEKPEYHYTSNNNIAEGVMEFAYEHNIQLVIAVPKKRGFFESIFKRSLTQRLTFDLTIPLLLIRTEA